MPWPAVYDARMPESASNGTNHENPNGDAGFPMTVREAMLARDTWRMFRILGEFTDGFEVMNSIAPAVSIFGSARTPESAPEYQQAMECARQFCKKDFAVITGGGPGIMEAGNRGAFECGGTSVGLNIKLPHEQDPNPYQTHSIDFRYFFVRKVMFVKYACGFVIFPGGFGTLDEFFESLTLIQTVKIDPFPVVCVGHKFWDGLLDWAASTLRDEYKTISPKDLDLLTVTDDVDEAVRIVADAYEPAKYRHGVETALPGMLPMAQKAAEAGHE